VPLDEGGALLGLQIQVRGGIAVLGKARLDPFLLGLLLGLKGLQAIKGPVTWQAGGLFLLRCVGETCRHCRPPRQNPQSSAGQ
jgi:hypothetical protein